MVVVLRSCLRLLPVEAGLQPSAVSVCEAEEDVAAVAAIRFPQRAATFRTLIGLPGATGMRIGKAIALDRGDVDLAVGGVAVGARRGCCSESTIGGSQ